MPISYTELPDSTYLEYTSYRSNAAPLSGGTPVPHFSINVALVLDRANDPTALLSSDWGSRQQQLAALNESGTLWSTYGADPTKYRAVLDALHADGIQTVDELGANGYVSSVESRTIWVHLDETNFTTLFGPGATLYSTTTPTGQATLYWNGNLSLPDAMVSAGVSGLWFDTGRFEAVLPNPGGGVQAAMPQGPQSLGNSSGSAATNIFPQQIADDYYNFPLSGALWDPASGSAVATKAIGLVEPGVGTALPAGSASFQALIDHYRHEAGISTSATVITVDGGGQAYPDNIVPPAFNPAGERSLDVGVVTAINPQSPLIVYAGSGTAQDAAFNTFTAYQSAFWDTTHNPEVITSSFGFTPQVAPDSPFAFAARELFIDAALRNISVFSDNGDGGSGDQFGNGLTNVQTSRASPFGVMVGGTSLSTLSSAAMDATLHNLVALAMADDPATIWQLVAGGLTSLPSEANGAATLVETVWNKYFLNGTTIGQGADSTGFIHNNTGSGGVDPSQPVPSYQSAFGLTPTTSDPDALVGRGTPDVSANAGGNMFYRVPGATMTSIQNDDGTSAATPLWAALTSQFNAIFHDQGLPHLGYMNDLLYIAAAVAPGSFNDITMGNNTSSFTYGGAFTSDGHAITPTGFGYYAGPGYDLVTGLGTPNGVLLGRALTAIAHSEMSFSASPDVIDADGHGGWTSGADQSLLFQTMSDAVTQVGLHTGPDAFGFFSTASDSFAWTSRMAEQSLQPDFDPNLVIMFDKQAQGAVMQSSLSSGEALAVSINASPAQAIQAGLSSPFGFADFLSGDAAVRVARPVAVAETADGGSNEIAIVRLRQDGQDNLSLTFYRVDDLNGTINGLHPGDAGYQAALQARAYQMSSGSTSVVGPGYGNYEQADLLHVNAGDLIAMQLTNNTHGNTYLGFAQANETVHGQPVGHLWNYGLNTWGWEDTFGGGDHDYNDLIVQLDFTSASGHGWLA
jgi:hypothetical protein